MLSSLVSSGRAFARSPLTSTHAPADAMDGPLNFPCTLDAAPELRDLMPFHSQLVAIGDDKMHVVVEGRGPTVLLLHGNPTWSFFFRSLIDKLRTSFRVIAPDHLGCGLSSRTPGRRFRAVDRIEHLRILLDSLEVEKFSLVMHDWGGAIGTGLAVREVSRVEKLVYFNTTLTETESLPGMIKRAANPLIGKFLTYHTMDFLKLMASFGVTKSLPRDVKQGYYLPYREKRSRQAIWDFVCDIPFDQNHPSYPAMLEMASQLEVLSSKPVQIVWGLRDPCFHRAMMDKVAVHFPQAELHEFPNASHLVLEDAPEVPELVEAFLQRPEQVVVPKVAPTTKERRGGALYEAIRAQALDHPYQDAVVTAVFLGDTPHYRKTSYSQLFGLVQQYERALESLGLTAGDRVVLLVKPGPDFLALAYAVIGRGAVPVFMDPGMGRDNLRRAFEEVNARGFIGVPRAHLLRFAARDAYKRCAFHVVAVDAPVWRMKTLRDLKRFSTTPKSVVHRAPSETELLAFTSGGTGAPKGVIFTSEMLEQQLEIFRDSFGLEAGAKDLPLLPIFSLFGVALGVTAVVPPIDPAKPIALDPKRVVRMLQDEQVTSSFGSPTLWGKLAEYCMRSRLKLPSLRRVFMAGAPVPARVLELLNDVLPNGEGFTPYGATEALPVTLLSARDLQRCAKLESSSGGSGTFVGSPVHGVEVRVAVVHESHGGVPVSFTECQPGEVGEIIVRGANVSPAYFGRELATVHSKIRDGAGFWHRMGDLGYTDFSGGLFFCGRAAHAVHTPEGLLCTDPVENIVNMHPLVRRSALIGLNDRTEPAVVIEPLPSVDMDKAEVREQIARGVFALLRQNPFAHRINKIFFHPSLPVDGRHNAKIFRDRLALWAVDQPFCDSPQPIAQTKDASSWQPSALS